MFVCLSVSFCFCTLEPKRTVPLCSFEMCVCVCVCVGRGLRVRVWGLEMSSLTLGIWFLEASILGSLL